jgi:hypothetical protein
LAPGLNAAPIRNIVTRFWLEALQATSFLS